ncbi:hypothetical protein KFK09_015515 [Dendrobium nobile]|uniref:Uncharacterized protein n=1 Tax=Dendrobium nobile TaxID=94219 RepID=A0A8T3B7G8_DENNO|nr:hypothetical protein KFK09_015515 [Dendrobium nobile]
MPADKGKMEHLLRKFDFELISPFPEIDWNAMVFGVKGNGSQVREVKSVIAYEEHLATGPPCRSVEIPSSSSLQSKATGSCNRSVCGIASKQLTLDFPQLAVHPQRFSSGIPLSTSNEALSAWKRKEFIPISPPSRAAIVADDGITISLDIGAVHANKEKLDGLNLVGI